MSQTVFRRPALSALMLALCAAFAETAAAASISGKVETSVSHRPAVGVRVSVLESGRQVLTDGNGRYTLEGLASGNYTLTVEIDGSERARATVTVTDQGAAKDFSLDAKVATLESVQVLAQRTSSAVARAAQQDAPNQVSIATAEEIRKLPDVSAGEALARLPGVSLTYDTAEGRFVLIRGINADFNSVTFGGLRLPPSNNASPSAGRAVAMDAIPTGLIGAMTVTKTLTPEQDAEAIGGTIDITPKTAPLSGKPFFEGHIGSGREFQRQSGIVDLSVTAGTRFGVADLTLDPSNKLVSYSDRPFSVVGTATYYEDKRGIDDVEEAYNDTAGLPSKSLAQIDQRYYQYHRTRHAFGLDLEYQPNADSKYYARAFTAGYTETVNRQRLTINLDGNPVGPDANGNITDTINGGNTLQSGNFQRNLRDHAEKVGNRVMAFGGSNRLGEDTIDYRVGFTRGSFDNLYDRNTQFQYIPPANTTTVTTNSVNGGIPLYTVAGANPYNPANYTLAAVQNTANSIVDEERAYQVNFKMPTQFTDMDGENIKVGLNARLRNRNLPGTYTYGYNAPIGAPLNNYITDPAAVSFYNGTYNNGPLLNTALVQGLYLNPTGATLNPATVEHESEDVYAAYGQYEFGYGNWSFLGGARGEITRAQYTHDNQTQVNKTVTGDTPETLSRRYNNFFPSIQARYAFAPDLIGRLAASTAIARPTFGQVNAVNVVDTGTQVISQGNINLKPQTSVNTDVSIEKYLPHAGILSAALFNKQFTDYILQNQSLANIGGVIYKVQSYTNAGGSYARGLELNYVQHYEMLPGIFGGLGTSANYTFVDSNFQIRPGENSQLPLTSKGTGNLALFWEKDGITARVGLYYVSRNLFTVGTGPGLDTFQEDRTTVDASATYALDKQLSLYLNFKNITNEPLKYTEGASDRPIQREFYNVTMQVGLNFNY